ncbi:hypothetical protein TWF569_011129 [Orbilia oligospora]|nr:hypothetical protein TWF706_003496 [Orbilia oligospora]KAF3131503.1 hypothetical protein TWF569_011129 [Orbilia oligospora]KAF3152348.1 hypothetical protein TWF594_004044 [Orbilia oligospora]
MSYSTAHRISYGESGRVFSEAIGKNPERHLALAVMGASPSAVIWILRKFPHWSPVHALNLCIELLSKATELEGPVFLERINNMIPEILKVPIWFLVQWVQDDGVVETFENRICRLVGTENSVYSAEFNSDLFLASIIEDPSLIQFVYSKTGVMSPSDYN